MGLEPKRTSSTTVQIPNHFDIPVTLFANTDVPIETDAIEQLQNVLAIQETNQKLWDLQTRGSIKPFWGERPGQITQAVLTPDFHYGGTIPVGTVLETQDFILPQAVGNDVCCGMRLLMTDITVDEIMPFLEKLDAPFRAIFFQGKRDIPMSPKQREALLLNGLWGLHETSEENQNSGLWRYYHAKDQERDLTAIHFNGVLPAKGIFAYEGYIQGSGAKDGRDSHIGTIGGGNHFVEIQTVEEIFGNQIAHEWGVKKNAIALMIHSGSVELGHAVGGRFTDLAKSIYPSSHKHPRHGFYGLPTNGPHQALAASYLDAMNNAANFAFGNRLFLGLMAIRALSETLGREIGTHLIYDAPHNLIWDHAATGFIHRKGACPAHGMNHGANFDRFRYTGDPVIIPGSMGSSSYLLAGQGNQSALQSACHGAGRILSRGKSRNIAEEQYNSTFSKLRVVTPIDPHAPEVRLRTDILTEYHSRLKEEAPYAYKDVTPVIETVKEAKIATPVARLWPLLTVKG